MQWNGFIPLDYIELNSLLHICMKHYNKSQFTCKINSSGFYFFEFNVELQTGRKSVVFHLLYVRVCLYVCVLHWKQELLRYMRM